MLKKSIIVLLLILLAVLASLFLPSLRPEPAPTGALLPAVPEQVPTGALLPAVPEQFAGLQLVSTERGEAAMREILKLHRNPFPLLDGLIARYSGAAEATVWVSLSPTVDEAGLLMQRMVETMPASTVFREESVFSLQDQQIYHVTGMDMDHFYWLDGLYVYWLAVGETESPLAVLEAFLQAL